MKKFAFAIAAASLIPVACSNEAAVEEVEEVASETSGVVADLGGEPAGPIYTENQGETLALSGYDAVSYFVGDGTPVEGSADYLVKYQGYDYQFASQENAETFAADPAKYAPAYGGYCAWAIGANDALAPGDPNVYEIVDGKLYLNFNKQVQENWTADKENFINQADENYPKHDPSEHYTA